MIIKTPDNMGGVRVTEVILDRAEMALFLLAFNDVTPKQAFAKVDELIKHANDGPA